MTERPAFTHFELDAWIDLHSRRPKSRRTPPTEADWLGDPAPEADDEPEWRLVRGVWHST